MDPKSQARAQGREKEEKQSMFLNGVIVVLILIILALLAFLML